MGSTTPAELLREPLKKGASIDHLEYFDVTPIIGREYPTAKLKDVLSSPSRDEQLRDLAITICERGVVFFRAPQDDLSIDEQNYVINSEAQAKLYATMKTRPSTHSEPRDLGREWHSDSLFETCPSDFSFLRMQATPASGGDTLWASGYELYDRLSEPFARFLETLTASCAQPVFASACEAGGYEVMSPRGSPLNVGMDFAPSHPVVRTHPVTGWKTLFAAVGLHVARIEGLTSREEAMVRDYALGLLTRNHDCVARMRWTTGACAIWSNVCTLHAATPDTHLVDGIRTGVRASGIGEVPYLDPASTGRREALGMSRT